MSRLVMILGILLILVGGAGLLFDAIVAPALISDTPTRLREPTAADLCQAGEQLVTESNSSRSENFYCVNNAGTRRDVTLDAATKFPSEFRPSISAQVIPLVSGGLFTMGFFLALLGFIFERKRRLQDVTSP